MSKSERTRPLRVLFLIRSLHIGGAERQLLALVKNLDPQAFTVAVVPMYSGGELQEQFRSMPHIQLLEPNKRKRWDVLGFLTRLMKLTYRFKPDVVHGYMSGANELALAVGRLVGAKVIWGVRVSDLDHAKYRGSVRIIFRIGALLSKCTDLIIANSDKGRQHHIKAGYSAQRFIVIPNGIDSERFLPSTEARKRFRDLLGVQDQDFCVICPARLDPMKGHEVLLKALARLEEGWRPVVFFIGNGPETMQADLVKQAAGLGLQKIYFRGAVDDVVGLYNAADIVVSASLFGEGFQNVIAEAMSCGRPVIATDVGDARLVVGDCGTVVPPGDVMALAEALSQLLGQSAAQRQRLGDAARAYMGANFSTKQLASRTADAIFPLVLRKPS